MLQTTLKNISLVPTEEGTYTATIQISDSLKTSYNRCLVFQQGMKGVAEIITDDLRLIERFINPIRKILEDKI